MSESKSLSAKYQDVLLDLIARRDEARATWDQLDEAVNALKRYAVTSSAAVRHEVTDSQAQEAGVEAVPAGLATQEAASEIVKARLSEELAPTGVRTHKPQFPLHSPQFTMRGATINIKAPPRAIEQPTVECALVPDEPAKPECKPAVDTAAKPESNDVSDIVIKPRNEKAQAVIIARKKAGLSQTEVAAAAGVSVMTVSRVEKGLHVSPHTRARIIGAIPSAEPKHESGPQCTGERACPRPIVPGQSMCKAHLDMFEQPVRFNSSLHQ